jgi:beta-phosphoglucomutase family hydrolase
VPAPEPGPLGLPPTCQACLFDLDGVLTDTASVHTRAWTSTFDAFLRGRAEQTGEPFTPFDPHADYLAHVDGRPRQDGVREFLRSRGIDLPEGDPDDPPDRETVWGVGNRKNEEFQRTLREDGVLVFEGSRRYLEAVRDAGLHVAVVSSSANTADVLEVTGLAQFVHCRVDGVTLREEGIAGKPAPDSFLRAAEILGVDATAAAVFEDALSGVQAGRAGGFGCVVGVDRAGHADALRENGADVVVQDLEELL